MRKSQVNNLSHCSGRWHKYTKQASSHSTMSGVFDDPGSARARVSEPPLIRGGSRGVDWSDRSPKI